MKPRLSSLKDHPNILCLGGLGRPFGINSDAQGKIYITDMDLHTVFCLSSDLKTISSFGEGLNGPHSIAFDDQNNAYVTTYYSPGITVFTNPKREFLNTIGVQTTAFPLKGPASAFLNNQNQLMVSEYALNAIYLYSLQGNFLGQLEFDSLDRPHMTKQGLDGYYYCADTWNHRIQRLNPKEKTVSWLGFEARGWTNDKVHLSSEAGGFHAPVSLSINSNGDLLISDWGNHRLQIFSSAGELKYVIDHLGLNKPYDAQYLAQWIVVADSHHGRVLFIPQSDYQ